MTKKFPFLLVFCASLALGAAAFAQGGARGLGDEKYFFRDASGEIVVEIDDDLWRRQTVEAKDAIEIRGEVDRDWAVSVEIEADSLQKL
ncbi:MAG: NirD/YgiW/YdeI family stress tolerance protein [Candidatus Accumulibacter sp.]|jgi:uncharacterized protein (TIGR00156 family)|nr:NirD/YgiW/YdeI family stress tolerance protein [Accumulibacter sp.]